ncbi:MAG TPA: baseplate J/gp47 family protein [Terrimicrobiaceae bacterium]
MAGPDRLTALCDQATKALTGIDFVQVLNPEVQTVLRVFFHIDPDQLAPPLIEFPPANPADVDFPLENVSIVSISGGESVAEANVVRATWTQAILSGQSRVFLEVEVAEPGDFSIYRLTIDSPRIDRFFNGVEFSFKQGCPSNLDCKSRQPECPPPDLVDFPVDYLARDFTSLRSALLDFAAQRYPNWAEVIEADAGVMLAEVMAALGDEFSYTQDRFAREAYLETATQRRSMRWHTTLVDYPIHDGLSATTLLAIGASGGGAFVAAGTRVWAILEGGGAVPFEIGEGLLDEHRFWVHPDWNVIPAHIPDASKPCLPIGSTEIYLSRHFPDAQLPKDSDVRKGDDDGRWTGRAMLLETTPEDPSLPVRRHLVRIVEFEQGEDPLILKDGLPATFTRVEWDASEATPFELLLESTTACVNILPATAGETHTEYFAIGSIPDNASEELKSVSVEREGPCNELTGQRSVTYLSSLSESEKRGLGWRGELRRAEPEIELLEVQPDTLTPFREWIYLPSLLDATSRVRAFSLENGIWRTIFEVERSGRTFAHPDYASQSGFTIRFGDGEFGLPPAGQSVFRVRYRTDAGTIANLPADSVTALTDPSGSSPASTMEGVASVRNPFAITSGVDPEDAAVVRQLAPEAFKAETFRAVRDEDYREHAEKVEGVQRAGAKARWTGSWLTEFVTVDPLNAFSLSEELRLEVENSLDRVRQVGREVFVNDPIYLNVDLIIHICIEPTAYAGQVVERVVGALTVEKSGLYEELPFFHPNNFTFGTPLYRAALEAAVQAVPGVRAVGPIQIQARGITKMRSFAETVFEVSERQILRIQNDPRFPERGSLRVYS